MWLFNRINRGSREMEYGDLLGQVLQLFTNDVVWSVLFVTLRRTGSLRTFSKHHVLGVSNKGQNVCRPWGCKLLSWLGCVQIKSLLCCQKMSCNRPTSTHECNSFQTVPIQRKYWLGMYNDALGQVLLPDAIGQCAPPMSHFTMMGLVVQIQIHVFKLL